MSEAGNGGNGKVTLAVLRTDLQHLTGLVQEMREESREREVTCVRRIGALEMWKERSQERWDAHKADHQKQNLALSVASAVEAAVSAVVGVLVGKA